MRTATTTTTIGTTGLWEQLRRRWTRSVGVPEPEADRWSSDPPPPVLAPRLPPLVRAALH
jgi:hypothetical protein